MSFLIPFFMHFLIATFLHFIIAVDTGLNGKIALGKGDWFFARIAVLGDKVTSVAGEHEIINFAFAAFAEFDHFRDATKMISRAILLFKPLTSAPVGFGSPLPP